MTKTIAQMLAEDDTEELAEDCKLTVPPDLYAETEKNVLRGLLPVRLLKRIKSVA